MPPPAPGEIFVRFLSYIFIAKLCIYLPLWWVKYMHETHLGQTSPGRGWGGGREGEKKAVIRSACQGNDRVKKGERRNTESFTAISLFCAIKGFYPSAQPLSLVPRVTMALRRRRSQVSELISHSSPGFDNQHCFTFRAVSDCPYGWPSWRWSAWVIQ